MTCFHKTPLSRRLRVAALIVFAIVCTDSRSTAATIITVVPVGGQADLEGDTLADGDPFAFGLGDDPGIPANLNRSAVENALGAGPSVEIRAEGDIVVDADIGWNTGSTLRLDADNNILINSSITSVSGALEITAPNGTDVTAPIDIDVGLTFSGELNVESSGEIRGNASTDSNVSVSGGLLAPGNSSGVIDIGGDLTTDVAAFLEIEIGGLLSSQFDRILVNGVASLDGTIDASLINSFAPSLGTSFDIVEATVIVDQGISVTGPFTASVVDLGSTEVLRLTTVPEPTSFTLSIVGLVWVFRRRFDRPIKSNV